MGVPKGLRVVLEESGVNTYKMTSEKMREILGSHPDFTNEKSSGKQFLGEEKGHIVYMLPKYQCELTLLRGCALRQSDTAKRTVTQAYSRGLF